MSVDSYGTSGASGGRSVRASHWKLLLKSEDWLSTSLEHGINSISSEGGLRTLIIHDDHRLVERPLRIRRGRLGGIAGSLCVLILSHKGWWALVNLTTMSCLVVWSSRNVSVHERRGHIARENETFSLGSSRRDRHGLDRLDRWESEGGQHGGLANRADRLNTLGSNWRHDQSWWGGNHFENGLHVLGSDARESQRWCRLRYGLNVLGRQIREHERSWSRGQLLSWFAAFGVNGRHVQRRRGNDLLGLADGFNGLNNDGWESQIGNWKFSWLNVLALNSRNRKLRYNRHRNGFHDWLDLFTMNRRDAEFGCDGLSHGLRNRFDSLAYDAGHGKLGCLHGDRLDILSMNGGEAQGGSRGQRRHRDSWYNRPRLLFCNGLNMLALDCGQEELGHRRCRLGDWFNVLTLDTGHAELRTLRSERLNVLTSDWRHGQCWGRRHEHDWLNGRLSNGVDRAGWDSREAQSRGWGLGLSERLNLLCNNGGHWEVG
jgi:hypothetical protein